MYLQQKFLLIIIQVSGLLMTPRKAALVEMTRGFCTGRQEFWWWPVATSHCLPRGHLWVNVCRGAVATGSGTRPCLLADVVMVANHAVTNPTTSVCLGRWEWQPLLWWKLSVGRLGCGQWPLFFFFLFLFSNLVDFPVWPCFYGIYQVHKYTGR